MTPEEFEYLQSEPARAAIEDSIRVDPLRLALSGCNRAVCSLVGVLQKCERKLPDYYSVRCIVDQRAYEQSSSQATAAARNLGHGRLAVDLTCGLGVDTLELSRHYTQVISIEIDPLRASVARYNFHLLGADNVKVINCAAEDFVRDHNPLANGLGNSIANGLGNGINLGAEPCSANIENVVINDDKIKASVDFATQKIDLIYVDPSRRSTSSERVYSLEDSSPNILELLPLLRQMADRVAVKLSPLFDIAQVVRLLGGGVEVVSLDGECKEVIAHIPDNNEVKITAIRGGRTYRFCFDSRSIVDPTKSPPTIPILSGEAAYLHQPDVALYKSRTLRHYMSSQYPAVAAIIEDYIFTDQPLGEFCGTSFAIESSMPYQPKAVARELKRRDIRRANLHHRNFPHSTAAMCRALGISQGGEHDLFCTIHRGVPTVFFVTKIV